MTYPLNTTLIFTSLTQASAAADLWGDMEIDSYILGADGICWYSCFDPLAEKWRIVLDTEEKVQWFTVQVGDFIADGIIGGVVKRVLSDGVDYETCCATNFCHSNSIKILYRDGKPFPQPQEIRHD